MKTSIVTGARLPESLEEFQELAATKRLRFSFCLACEKPFGPTNVQTPAGWRETQIGGFCETCFDALWADQPATKDTP